MDVFGINIASIAPAPPTSALVAGVAKGRIVGILTLLNCSGKRFPSFLKLINFLFKILLLYFCTISEIII